MDKNEMKLSIVVNMYNTAKYLPKCLDTLLHQDIPVDDYEIILVDDSSSDNSLSLANEYAQLYANVKVLSHTHNRGLAAGRNTGVDAATGKYLTFVDPDDYIKRNSLSAILKQMDDEQLDMLRLNYQKVDEQYNKIPDNKYEKRFNYASSIMSGSQFIYERLGIACYVWAFFFRTEIIKKHNIRFIEGIYLDDTPWLPRVLQVANRVNCSSQRHHFYLQRSSSMVRITDSSVMPKKISGLINLIETLQKQQKESVDNGVVLWYGKIIAFSVLTLLRMVVKHDYKNCVSILKILKKDRVFPLIKFRESFDNLIRISLLSFNPRLYCVLLHITNKLK